MPIRCCYKPGHHVPAEPPGVIGRGRGGDTNLLPCDSGGGRGDAATGVTRRRWRGQSAELLYQGADKPVPEFISHNDQICGGRRSCLPARRCYLLEWPGCSFHTAGRCWDSEAPPGNRARPLHLRVWPPIIPVLPHDTWSSLLHLCVWPSIIPVLPRPHSHPFSIFVSDHPSSLSCPCPPAHPFSSFLSPHPSSPSCPCPAHPFSISTIPVWYAGLKWKCWARSTNISDINPGTLTHLHGGLIITPVLPQPASRTVPFTFLTPAFPPCSQRWSGADPSPWC